MAAFLPPKPGTGVVDRFVQQSEHFPVRVVGVERATGLPTSERKRI